MLNENVHIMLSQNTIRIFVLAVGDTHGQTLIQLKCLITPLRTRIFPKSCLGVNTKFNYVTFKFLKIFVVISLQALIKGEGVLSPKCLQILALVHRKMFYTLMFYLHIAAYDIRF